MQSKICLVLTENTIKKNLKLIEAYRPWIDIAELRADFLKTEELLHMRKFPRLAEIPVILTVRRVLDGGTFAGGEGSRITLFARGLAFSDTNPVNNFAYIDFESDMYVSALEEVARAYGIGIIRSYHSINKPITDIDLLVKKIRRTDYEIVKISFTAHELSDVTTLFKKARLCKGKYSIMAMGKYGLPSRILAPLLGSSIVYTMPAEYIRNHKLQNETIDPITLHKVYRFKSITKNTKVYGITGIDTSKSLSPIIHNERFEQNKINAVYIPFSASNINDAIHFSEQVPLTGFSVTYPFKFDIIPFLANISPQAKHCGAVNTVLSKTNKRYGFNTDIDGLTQALKKFLDIRSLRFKHIAIIGTGGAAYAAAHTVRILRGKACIFGRTAEKARSLSKKYRFEWALLDSSCVSILKQYSYLIIQTTSIGMSGEGDPIDFYSLVGTEKIFDVIYTPEKTPLLKRAEKAGCKISNGYPMLCYQAYHQFDLFKQLAQNS